MFFAGILRARHFLNLIIILQHLITVHIQNNSTPQNKKQWMRKSFCLNFSFIGLYVKCYRTWSFVVAATAAQMTSLKRVREIKRLLTFFIIIHKKILSFLKTQQKNHSKLLSTRFIFIHSWTIKFHALKCGIYTFFVSWWCSRGI